jgi:glutamate formiminotransferase/glutamate formiminotransferase/formiminotetrahydrofolate cyclodeaminase
MNTALLECVPNISAGRDLSIVDAVAQSISRVPGTLLLHRTSDADHNRSVITFAGPPDAVSKAAFAAVQQAGRLIDLTRHRGVHPRVGALDVLPFVPIQGMSLQNAIEIAWCVGERIWSELQIPVYFYEAAARRPERVKLENVRRGQFEGLLAAAPLEAARQPDIGGPGLHPSAGAVIVGAREFLIAYNINLKSTDLQLARSIATKIRERDGGLPGIKALGLPLLSRNLVQVSINITAYKKTPLPAVYSEVEKLAATHGVEIEESELIGLIPRAAIDTAWVPGLKLTNFSPDRIVEMKIEQLQQR